VREGAHRDVVYSIYGRIDQNRLGRHPARHLDLRPAGHARHRVTHLEGRHVVEQQPGRAGRKRRVDLRGVAHLDRQRQVRPRGAGAAHRLGDPAGERRVVLLDEDGVVEAGAVVDAAAVRDRRLLEPPQPRRGLARVEDLRHPARSAHRRHHARGQRRDPRQAAEEVQRSPLGGQQRPRVALDDERDPRLPPHPLRPGLDVGGGIQPAEHARGDLEAGDDAGRLLGDRGAPAGARLDGGGGGGVAVADVLGEGGVDELVVRQSQSTTMVRKSGSLAPCSRAPETRSSRRYATPSAVIRSPGSSAGMPGG
jgi:hypothetical protein